MIFLSLFLCLQAQAQLSVGEGTLSLYSGSVMKVDKLLLAPTQRLDIANNRLEQSSIAVSLNGSVNSISQVLSFSSPVIFTGMVRFFFDPNFLNGHSAENLKLSYKGSTNWHASTQSAVDLVNNCIDEVLTAKPFEGLTASIAYVSLPVNLVSFTARWQDDQSVLLQWQTAGEDNNSHFIVERSGNGQQFTSIGRVDGAAAAGPAAYAFTDKQPPTGTIYYRLRQYDRDGLSRVYGVRMLRPAEGSRIHLFPNPATGAGFTVDVKKPVAKPMMYSISNAAGQIVQTGRLVNQQQWIATAGLAAGYYLLQLSNGQTVRFQKQ